MEKIEIERRGSLLYTRGYRRLVVALTLVYAAVGAAMAVLGARVFDRALAGIIIFALVLGMIALMWMVYGAILWIFARESRQGVEINDEGVRETHDGREHAFIPWAGVKEIEIAATLVAGASLRVKGNFSEIAVSNVDLAITRPMKIREMHKALGQSTRMRELLLALKRAAPHAALRMNRLARRRLKKYEWAGSN
ncbi:MAG: hypothetical protein L0229_28165 [Blastocatellia bacterium]|nr:hypothetical protein [Blastocatellia bacterium]